MHASQCQNLINFIIKIFSKCELLIQKCILNYSLPLTHAHNAVSNKNFCLPSYRRLLIVLCNKRSHSYKYLMIAGTLCSSSFYWSTWRKRRCWHSLHWAPPVNRRWRRTSHEAWHCSVPPSRSTPSSRPWSSASEPYLVSSSFQISYRLTVELQSSESPSRLLCHLNILINQTNSYFNTNGSPWTLLMPTPPLAIGLRPLHPPPLSNAAIIAAP